MKQFIQI